MTHPGDVEEPVLLHAAGSLRSAVRQILGEFQVDHGVTVEATFGPAGLLRQRIEDGEPSAVFASANMAHPQRLHALGLFEVPIRFARNRICAIARADLGLTTANLIDMLLDGSVRVGTSTPVADPSGDYALEVFARIDAIVPGAGARLCAKAYHLVGGPRPVAVPSGRLPAEWLITSGHADIFLGYGSGAFPLRGDARLTIVELPAACAVTADYGVGVSAGASHGAHLLSGYLCSDVARQILEHHGFQGIA